MSDPLVILPVAAVVLQGFLTSGPGQIVYSLWPGALMALAAHGSGAFLRSRAANAQRSDGAGLNNLATAFGISLAGPISMRIGGALVHARRH